MLMWEIKDALNEWRDILYSWARRINPTKMSVFHKLMYSSHIIPNKIQNEL